VAIFSPADARSAVDRGLDDTVTFLADLVRVPSLLGDEEPAQELVEARLQELGFDVRSVEPDPERLAERPDSGIPLLPYGGRRSLVGTIGDGTGRSLLLNGHVDVVSAEPVDRWTREPFGAEIADGRMYGRGACDMKGGVACMVYATEVLSRLGVRLAGDVVVNTVTDEESSGAGGLAAARHGVRADAGIVPEPTAFEVWVACRGSLTPTITVEGRPGHAEMAQPHWQAGGAVNAIEKMGVVLDAVRRLREEWNGRPDKQHPHLSSGTIVPVKISGGEWAVTYPASCSLTCEVMYLPGNADGDGWGREVESEIEAWIAAAAAADPWLTLHPPAIEWALDIPPAEVDAAHPIVEAVARASAAAGEPPSLGGLDSWFDAATFTRFADTPSIGFGPRSLAWGHTIDEYVPVADLVSCTQALALAAVDYCGVAE
jgi:acetylornithine deacetylase